VKYRGYRQRPQPAPPANLDGCAECRANRVHLTRGTVSAVTSKVMPARFAAIKCKTCPEYTWNEGNT
jgi:uncharacterized protein with PIN domain